MITLWRAADDDYVQQGTSFAELCATAEIYRRNPGFGGARLYRSIITPPRP